MGKAVVDKDASGKRKNLSLVLQPAEGSRENQPVIIALKFAAIISSCSVIRFLSEALCREKLIPVHYVMEINSMKFISPRALSCSGLFMGQLSPGELSGHMVLLQFCLQFFAFVIRDLVHKFPEMNAMIHFLSMTELVQDHIINQMGWQEHQVKR